MSYRDSGTPVDYELSTQQARVLAEACQLPSGQRKEAIERAGFGRYGHLDMLVAMLGLANSLVDNCREAAEIILTTQGNMHPYTAERVNLPTLFGALAGVLIAKDIDPTPLCAGCAYRKGTWANQSLGTLVDAEVSVQGEGHDGHFYCHDELEDESSTDGACACSGYAQALRTVKESE